MKRLPEEFDPGNRDQAYLASLLERVPRAEPSEDQMQRVWATLERSASRRSRGRMRGPVIVGLVLCGATAASAMMPHVWKRWQQTSVEVAPPDATAAAENRRAPRVSARAAPAATEAAPVAAPSAPPSEASVSNALLEAVPVTAAVPEAAVPRVGTARKTVVRTRPTPAETGDPLASGALMVEAIRERRAGNIARARELATEYRAKNPTGALQEEALALCMESASGQGDDDAKQLASLYLQRYPRGRFRAQAQRVMETSR